MNRIHPKKLLLTKWTTVAPQAKDKHFLVTQVVQPEVPGDAIEWVEIEAVFSKRCSASRGANSKTRTVGAKAGFNSHQSRADQGTSHSTRCASSLARR